MLMAHLSTRPIPQPPTPITSYGHASKVDDQVEVTTSIYDISLTHRHTRIIAPTKPDTLRPVVRLGTFEHVVSPSRPEEQEVDYEVMARDYAKMTRWDYRSGNRTPSQASSVP
uniref:Uncharacterized protein n=1 Tax=Hyaloperonospora arabidopsidis (strain Emoy2) TaxID=559515 RepID=M4BV46_HYAAE